MKLRMAAACIAAGTLLSVSTSASAAAAGDGEKGKVMGIRLEASLERDFNLVGPGGLSGGAAGSTGAFGSPSPHGDIRIGYDLPMGLTPLLGLGFRSFSQEVVTTPPDGGGDPVTSEFSGTAVTLALELRFYLKKHKKGLQPYVWGEYNTSFLSATVNDDTDADDARDAENERLTFLSDLNNHGEINLGLGAEYKFSRAFGIGGKWGLGIGLTGGDFNDPPGGDDQTNIRTDATTIGTSAAVYAAWRL